MKLENIITRRRIMATVKQVLNESIINRIKRVFPHEDMPDYTIHEIVRTLFNISHLIEKPNFDAPPTKLEKLIDDIYEAEDNYNKDRNNDNS